MWLPYDRPVRSATVTLHMYPARAPAASRVEEAIRRVELLQPLEEKRPLLGEEQGESLVDRHLADVGLDLGEVGVHRPRERQVLRHSPAHVAPQLRRAAVVVARRRCRIA